MARQRTGSGAGSVIRFENVGLRYGLGAEVLKDVSFLIAPGSFQFVTGPSGAGKTSLLQAALPVAPADPRQRAHFQQGRRDPAAHAPSRR